jgi:hypothetical protein
MHVCPDVDEEEVGEGRKDGLDGVSEARLEGTGGVARGVKRRGKGLGVPRGKRRKAGGSGGEGGGERDGGRDRTIYNWISGEEQRVLKEKEQGKEKEEGKESEGKEGEWVKMVVALDGAG